MYTVYIYIYIYMHDINMIHYAYDTLSWPT